MAKSSGLHCGDVAGRILTSGILGTPTTGRRAGELVLWVPAAPPDSDSESELPPTSVEHVCPRQRLPGACAVLSLL